MTPMSMNELFKRQRDQMNDRHHKEFTELLERHSDEYMHLAELHIKVLSGDNLGMDDDL